MKKLASLICVIVALSLSGCGIFKKGCNCPKVYYKSYPAQQK
ncbi:hypothetical protein ACFOG5_18195 [Pedobacter fastidiosus]